MPLTQTKIQDIYLSGNINNSPLAMEFHESLYQQYGIITLASYYRENPKVQNTLLLLIRTNEQSLFQLPENKSIHIIDNDQTAEIFHLLYSAMDRHQISYTPIPFRKLTATERWINKLKKFHHIKNGVELESFDNLGRWHVAINAYRFRVFAPLRQIYPQIRKILPYPAPYGYTHIVILSKMLHEEEMQTLETQMLNCIGPKDPCHIFSKRNYRPIFKLEKDMSAEELSSLSMEVI